MLVSQTVKAGQEVQLPDHQRGKVAEVDHGLLVARIALNTGRELWERLDELEDVEQWDQQIGGEQE